MRKYDVYHSDKKGNNLFAASRTRPEAAIRIAEKISLNPGERVVVLQDLGDLPGDFKRIYSRKI